MRSWWAASPSIFLPIPPGGHLFVSDFEGGSVAQVDLATGLVERRFPVPDGPVGLALSADGRRLYVASYFGDKVLRFNLGSGALEATLKLAEESLPWDLKLVSGAGGRALLAVTEHHSNVVSFFDADTFARVASLPTTYFPYQMDVDAAGGRLYVASYGGKNGGELLAVDLAALTTAWVRPTGGGSFDVRVDPAHDRVLVTDFVGKTVTGFNTEGDDRRGLARGRRPQRVPLLGRRFRVLRRHPVAGHGGGARPADRSSAVLHPRGLPARPHDLDRCRRRRGPVLAVGNQGDGTISLLSAGDPVPEFTDVPAGHRFHREIRVLALRGALNGYPDGGGGYSFHPDDTLTRAQIAKILVGSLGAAHHRGGTGIRGLHRRAGRHRELSVRLRAGGRPQGHRVRADRFSASLRPLPAGDAHPARPHGGPRGRGGGLAPAGARRWFALRGRGRLQRRTSRMSWRPTAPAWWPARPAPTAACACSPTPWPRVARPAYVVFALLGALHRSAAQ